MVVSVVEKTRLQNIMSDPRRAHHSSEEIKWTHISDSSRIVQQTVMSIIPSCSPVEPILPFALYETKDVNIGHAFIKK